MIKLTDPDPVSDYEMMRAMGILGGLFAQHLAALWHHADERNRAKILATWQDECDEYRELVRLKRARQG